MNPQQTGKTVNAPTFELPSSQIKNARAAEGQSPEASTGDIKEKESVRGGGAEEVTFSSLPEPTQESKASFKNKKKKLSGARRKAKARANAAVSEKQPDATPSTSKRPHSDGSTPREVKRRAPHLDLSYSRAIPSPLKIAIVPASYPDVKFTPIDVEAAEELISGIIRTTFPKELYTPTFLDSWSKHGAYLIHCRRQEDKKWVEDRIQEWSYQYISYLLK